MRSVRRLLLLSGIHSPESEFHYYNSTKRKYTSNDLIDQQAHFKPACDLGFLDDQANLSRKIRLLCHLLAAAWLIYWLGAPSVQLLGWSLENWIFASLISLLGIIWFLNLYNFMDGTDGLATTEAMLVLLFPVFVTDHHSWGFLFIPLLALAGFLPFNWPKG